MSEIVTAYRDTASLSRHNSRSDGWEQYKDLIRQKYLVEKHTAKQVQQFMLNEYRFKKSLQQYGRIFTKWGFHKYGSGAEYETIARELKRKRLDADSVEITFGGRYLSCKKLKKELSRHVRPRLSSKFPLTSSSSDTSQSQQTSIAEKHCQSPRLSVRHVLAPGRVICTVQSIPWFDFIDTLSWKQPSRMSLHNSATKFGLPRSWDLEQATFGEHVTSFGIDSDGTGSVPHQSSATSILDYPSSNLEALVPERFSNKCSNPLSAMTSRSGGPTILVATSYIIYLFSNNLVPDHVRRQYVEMMLTQDTSPVLSALTKSNSKTARAVLGAVLLTVCEMANLGYVKHLMHRYQVDVNVVLPRTLDTKDPSTPLQLLIMNSKRSFPEKCDLIESLLKAGADPNKCGCHSFIADVLPACSAKTITSCHSVTCCQRLPLHMAVRQAHCTQIVKLLLESGARVCSCLNTTLAIEHDLDVKLLKELLEGGAQASYCGPTFSKYFFPLQAALGKQQSETAALLLDYGADPNELGFWASQVRSDLEAAILQECDYVYDREQGFGIEGLFEMIFLEKEWCSPLALSLVFDAKIAKRLLKIGAHADEILYQHVKDWYAWNMLSSEYPNWADSLQSLYIREPETEWIDAGGVLHISDDLFETALESAVKSRDVESVKLLLRSGASPNHSGQTPALFFAASTGQLDMVEILVGSGAHVDSTYTGLPSDLAEELRGRTTPIILSPLAAAAARDHINVVSVLIEAGADINFCHERYGLTLLQAAIICDAQRSVGMLLNHPHLDLWRQGTRLQPLKNLWIVTGHSEIGHGRSDALAVAIRTEIQRTFFQETAQTTTISLNEPSKSQVDRVHFEDPWGYICQLADSSPSTPTDVSLSKLIRLVDKKALSLYVQDSVNSAFVYAIDSKKFDVASFILEKGYGPDIKTVNHLLSAICESEWYGGFDHEARLKCADIVLRSQDWDLVAEEASGLTTLILKLSYYVSPDEESQITQNARSIAKSLIRPYFDRGGCPYHTVYRSHDSSLLQITVRRNDLELVRLLLSYNHKVCGFCDSSRDEDIAAALVQACGKGYEDMACELMARTADINRRCHGSGAALTEACFRNTLSVVKSLLSAGACINTRSGPRLETALETASRQGFSDIVAELIAWGGDINTDASSLPGARTALQAACDGGHLDVVILLVNKDADVNAPAGANRGVTALQAAAMRGCFKIVQILLGAGARVAAPASRIKGRTAIDGAAEFGRLDIVKFLLDKYDGDESIAAVCERAARYASRQGYTVVFELLAEYPGSNSSNWAQLPQGDLEDEDEEEEYNEEGDEGEDWDDSGKPQGAENEGATGHGLEHHRLGTDMSRNEFDDMFDADVTLDVDDAFDVGGLDANACSFDFSDFLNEEMILL